MSENPVELAVMRMDDDDVRERVGDGDFSDLADLELDDEQRAVLVQLAEQFSDVTGLAMTSFSGLVGGLDTFKGITSGKVLSKGEAISGMNVRGFGPAADQNTIGRL